MRISLRFLAAWLLVLCLLGSLAGCGPSPEESAARTQAAQTSSVASWTVTPIPSFTPRPTPTLTFTPTSLPTSTSTPTPELFPSVPVGAKYGYIVYTQGVEKGSHIKGISLESEPWQKSQLSKLSGFAFCPRWSPDTEWIGFWNYDTKSNGQFFWVVDMLKNREIHRVTTKSLTANNEFSWSPDSHYVLVTAPGASGTEADIYRIEIATGLITDLTADYTGWDDHGTYSPDGTKIVFTSDRISAADKGTEKGLDSIWIMQADGSAMRNLTPESSYENIKPSWSPDSRWVTFYRWSFLGGEEQGLYVVDTQTGVELKLADMPDTQPGMLGEGPLWSPDGRYIAYRVGPEDETNIYIVPVAGGDPIQITDLPGDENEYSWSPLSDFLLFTNRTPDGYWLYYASIHGTGVTRLLEDDANGCADWIPPVR